MKKIWNWIKKNPNRTMFLVPIILVAGISISHVVSWYDIANPFNWAIYLSIAIEVGAMTALVAATNKIKGGVWFMFGLVTFIQFVGNIFYSYKEIDPTGESFKMWVELTGPIWDLFSDSTDTIAMKRWLAILQGGFLPLISLASLHFFVKYEKPEENKEKETDDYFEARNRKMVEMVEKNKQIKEEQKTEVVEDDDIIDEEIVDVNEDESLESDYFDDYIIPEDYNHNSPKEEEITQDIIDSIEETEEKVVVNSPKEEETPQKTKSIEAKEILNRALSKEIGDTTRSVEELQKLGNKNGKSNISRID